MARSTRSVDSGRLPRHVVRAGLSARPEVAALSAVPARPEPALDDRFFRHMFHNMRTGVLAVSIDGRLAAINDVAYRVLGLTARPGDLGRRFEDVLHDCPEVNRVLQSAFETEDLPSRAELRLARTSKAIGYTLAHVCDDNGRLIGATLLFKDLARVEHLEERARLRDRMGALGEMAAAIAHEVKNPLASIEVMAGVLKRQLSTHAESQDALSDIIKEAKMANAIVVEVLELVRPIQPQVERVRLNEVIKDSITLAEGQVRRGAVSITTQIAEDVPELLADPHQLSQLFSNLLANAFEALRGEGHIDVRAMWLPGDEAAAGAAESREPQVVIEVRDSGPGMSPDDLERMFSPFFTTKPQSTGLGLAIVRKVVDAHDGRIHAASAPGRGATFRITLPVVPPVGTKGRR